MSITLSDPTREEMLAYLASSPYAAECDEFDVECAVYWYANHYHGGQWSELYAAICESPYSPGLSERGPARDSAADLLYSELESEYGKAD
jgi:hypothetical protein